MKLHRYYLISDDLNELELFEEQLESSGVTTPQIHVLSLHDTEIAHHDHINYVQSFMKKDVIHSTQFGAIVGIGVAAFILALASFAGWTGTAAGWTPFIFLAIVMLGFCTWEGGLIGMETPNHNFAQFSEALKNDRHILFIDLKPDQEDILKRLVLSHPKMELAGTGKATPNWLIEVENRVPRFFKHTFP